MMKEIHADAVKPKKNTVFYTRDYKEKRKGGANCYATAVFVHVCETKELIKKFVE